MKRRVGMLSGGVGSWGGLKREAERHGTDDFTLLFADPKMEDEDTYRFMRESAANIGGQLVEISDGRTPWEIFRHERILSARFDPCSKILKRELSDRWLRENRDPADTIVFVGIDWSEIHRFDRLRARRAEEGWAYEAPLCEAPYLTKDDMHEWAEREGLRKQRLYKMGFAHANCGGFCIKAGQAHFATLLREMPERFAYHEQQEQALRDEIGEGAFILKSRAGGVTTPITLKELREGIEAGGTVDLFDIGGCGCFSEPEAA